MLLKDYQEGPDSRPDPNDARLLFSARPAVEAVAQDVKNLVSTLASCSRDWL